MQSKPRLSKIVAELGCSHTPHRRATATTATLTAAEARKVRPEEARDPQGRNQMLPAGTAAAAEASYVSLQDRVADLNRKIHRYATNSARA